MELSGEVVLFRTSVSLLDRSQSHWDGSVRHCYGDKDEK